MAQTIATGAEPTWRTPTGNLPGPLQLELLMILHSLFEPNFALLRIPSLLSSIAAAALGWWVVRRHFGSGAALIALLLMAALPVNIAYARFGWDPSHVPLVGFAAAALALANRPLACAMVYAVALTTHPTSVFIAPFLILVLLGASKASSGWRDALIRSSCAAGLLLLVTLAVFAITTSGENASVHPVEIVSRLADPRQWGTFLLLYARLLTGDTVYQYIDGAGLAGGYQNGNVVALGMVVGLAASGIRSLRHRSFGLEAGVVAGWLAMLLGFFLVAGNGAITPHFERYAMCLIAPSVIGIAVLAKETTRHEAGFAKPIAVTLIIAILLLVGFERYYLHALQTSGSLSHRAFRTGDVEPKQAAFDAVIAEAGGRPVRLMAEDWWLAMPLAYLAAGRPIAVVDVSALPAGPIAPGRLWLTFAGSTLDQRLRATPNAKLRRTVAGTRRPALLHLWRTGAGAGAKTQPPS